ncbi:LysR family transcriptional regulator [Enteractinococcus helveticum]|uniref:HTH lysR-type domain-containing protein n=1 Tax=Enteractinococcus helveticum TaxID=1837282 RepID=A0A1B7M237_9MICC|nr:LysR family transcriptional regulator [Enteractinococcus helveticum]OAV62662.1 hypothetical protein A6F49_05755 [Enteractinococcus helveticum]
MINLTIRQLEYFQAIVEHGSATEAARACHVSQAGLSSAIRQLEDSLGVQLFVREKAKNLVLSNAGRSVNETINKVLRQLRELENNAKNMGDTIGGEVTIGCLHALSVPLLPPLAQYLKDEYPEIELRVIEGNYVEIDASLRRGEVEAILGYQEYLSGDLVFTDIGTQPLYVIMPEGHELQDKEEIDPIDLSGHPYILLDMAPMTHLVERIYQSAGDDSPPALTTKSNETMRALVARGLGLAISGIKPYGDQSVEGHRMVHRRLNFETGFRQITLARLQSGKASRNLTLITDYLRKLIRTHV